MFSITEQTATLAHINVRTEQHGDKPTGAVDLKFHFTGSNGFLAEYHQAPRSVFYKAVKLRDAILRLFPVNPAHTPRPSDELAAQRKGDA